MAVLDRESDPDLDLWEKDLTHEQDLDDCDDDMVNRAREGSTTVWCLT